MAFPDQVCLPHQKTVVGEPYFAFGVSTKMVQQPPSPADITINNSHNPAPLSIDIISTSPTKFKHQTNPQNYGCVVVSPLNHTDIQLNTSPVTVHWIKASVLRLCRRNRQSPLSSPLPSILSWKTHKWIFGHTSNINISIIYKFDNVRLFASINQLKTLIQNHFVLFSAHLQYLFQHSGGSIVELPS